MKMYSVFFLLALVLLFCIGNRADATDFAAPTPSTAPQSPSPQRPAPADDEDVVRITTKLVQVDAVITDKNGKVVTDLRPDEVRIFEDGRSQKITHFSRHCR